MGPDAMQTLLRVAWPGNVAELEHALRSALARRHTGQITVADLPESCHVTSRRVLSEWECLERDAIVRALKESGGDKIKAAVRLGISRATIYRKIRTFGIMVDVDSEHAEEERPGS
jgi:transcriptional regulator of acetoin/glycerol metabolism